MDMGHRRSGGVEVERRWSGGGRWGGEEQGGEDSISTFKVNLFSFCAINLNLILNVISNVNMGGRV